MKIQMVPLERIRPYQGNPRRIPQAAVKAVARSIDRFGFRQPLVLDLEYVIIAGHTRFLAAKLLGLEAAPCHLADLPPAQARQYRIADNRLNDLSDWDLDGLAEEFQAIEREYPDEGDLLEIEELMGFDDDEFKLVAAFGDTDATAALLGDAPDEDGVHGSETAGLPRGMVVVSFACPRKSVKAFREAAEELLAGY